MTKDKALKMALEALKSSDTLINGTETTFGLEGAMDGYYSDVFDVDGNNKLLDAAITAIKEALAQPVSSHGNAEDLYVEMSKHLNCPHCGGSGHIDDVAKPEQEPVRIMGFNCVCGRRIKVSAEQGVVPAPQRTWVGLTKEQLATTDWSADFRAGALWAEAKLKEKNNG